MKNIAMTAAVLLLAGCTAGTSFDTGRSSVNSSRLRFATIAGGRDMHTVIAGNPFAVPDDAFASAVTTTLNARNSRVQSNFTTTPGPSARPGFRLVLVFNQTGRSLSSAVCESPDALPLDPEARPIRLHIAFCQGDSDITGIRGRLAAANGPDDPRFQDFLAQALQLSQPTGVFRVGD